MAKSVGLLTGRIYEAEEVESARECTRPISDIDIADTAKMNRMHEVDFLVCESCRGCFASVEGGIGKMSGNLLRIA